MKITKLAYLANNSEKDLKQKQTSLQRIPPLAKNKKVDNSTEIENKSVDFNTLNYSEESINKHDTPDDFEWGSNFSTGISDCDFST